MMEKMKNKTYPNSDWLRRMADEEDRCVSVAVGGLAQELGMFEPAIGEVPHVFGRLIKLARRERGLTVEALANAANVELSEIVAIETEHDVVPKPRTVFQLAQVLKLPAPTLTELAGLAQPRKALSEAAVRFAARSEPTTKLTEDEKEAFEEFVKVLAEASDGS
jgi:transcriptional regulator with XRE-family HTH domain